MQCCCYQFGLKNISDCNIGYKIS